MKSKTAQEIFAALKQPFAPEDLEWRLQHVKKETPYGIAVPYVTNRAIQNRLDDVVGPGNWYNEYKPWHQSGEKASQLCGISIYFEETQRWVTKWDGAEDSDIEPVKGGLSDSMKRAAVQWGIGRIHLCGCGAARQDLGYSQEGAIQNGQSLFGYAQKKGPGPSRFNKPSAAIKTEAGGGKSQSQAAAHATSEGENFTPGVKGFRPEGDIGRSLSLPPKERAGKNHIYCGHFPGTARDRST